MVTQTLSIPDSPWLGDVMAAAATAVGATLPGVPEAGLTFPRHRSVIVIVVDGLGWNQLQERRGHVPTMRGAMSDARSLRTCLPSTTAAALTALCTGRLPGATRMVGYCVAQGDQTMNLLNFAPGVDAEAWQPCPTYFERMAGTSVRPVVVSTPKFSGTGFTRSTLRGARFYGVTRLEERFTVARRLAEEEPSLIYLYWADIDHSGHHYGVNSDEWLGELESFDRALGVFLRRLPRDTTVVLTADHGMVEVDRRIDIAHIPELATGVRLLAGEGRSVHVHALPGEAEAVRQRWQRYLGEDAVVLDPSHVADVLGPGPGNELVGDALVFLNGKSVVVDSRQHTASMIAQRGVHGSITDDEVLVPLLLWG